MLAFIGKILSSAAIGVLALFGFHQAVTEAPDNSTTQATTTTSEPETSASTSPTNANSAISQEPAVTASPTTPTQSVITQTQAVAAVSDTISSSLLSQTAEFNDCHTEDDYVTYGTYQIVFALTAGDTDLYIPSSFGDSPFDGVSYFLIGPPDVDPSHVTGKIGIANAQSVTASNIQYWDIRPHASATITVDIVIKGPLNGDFGVGLSQVNYKTNPTALNYSTYALSGIEADTVTFSNVQGSSSACPRGFSI